MGGLTSAVHWWEEWQLRVLVLTSLAIQILLSIFSYLRRSAIPRWSRSIMWLAYLAGDAVAIYALATLFNRQKLGEDAGGGSVSSSTLEVFWAPVLLMHLGGHDGITAYNIEDNELWSRHLLTAVSQVTVAIYVFCKSRPADGDFMLLVASIFLFISGVFRCLLKPWALKRASIYSLVSSAAAKQNEGDMYLLEEYVKRAKAFVEKDAALLLVGRGQKDEGEGQGARAFVDDEDHPRRNNKEPGIEVSMVRVKLTAISMLLDDLLRGAWAFVRGLLKGDEGDPSHGSFCGRLRERFREARNCLKEKERHNIKEPGDGHHPPSQRSFRGRPRERANKGNERIRERIRELTEGPVEARLFVDLSSPYRRRLNMFQNFWMLSEEKAYDSVRRGLASAFLLLYTRLKTTLFPIDNSRGPFITGTMRFRPVLAWTMSIIFFYCSDREWYNDVDVKVTYTILFCSAVLDASSLFFPMVLEKVDLEENPLGVWPEMVAQYSLIGCFARSKRHNKWMWIASLFGCKDFLDQHWCMNSCFSLSRKITALVLQYLKDGWKEKISDAPSYRRFNDHSSRWVLERNQCSSQVPGLRMKRPLPFDECVLLWHIATDFCFFSSSFSEHISASAEVPTILTRITEINKRQRDRSREMVSKVLPGVVTISSVDNYDQIKSQCREMSNYMVYLLFVNPEMLLPGTRRNLFITAYDDLKDTVEDNKFATAYKEIKDILKDKKWNVYRRVRTAMKEIKEILRNGSRNPISWSQWKAAPVKEKGVMERVISTMLDKSKNKASEKELKQGCEEESKESPREEYSKGGSEENFINDAWALAQGLLDLGHELGDKKMWEVIQGVWVEMLCYSASRCRGYLHAKALGNGGEFLSYVWLLLFHMGMETFTDKLQREQEPPSDGEAGSNDTAEPTREVSTTTSMDRLQREQLPSQGGNQYGTASTSEICEVADDVV